MKLDKGARWTVLCEDKAHEVFVRGFLGTKIANVSRRLVSRIAPEGKGDASGWILKEFPDELTAHQSKASHQDRWLVVAIDGDRKGYQKRILQLRGECERRGIEFRRDDENVLFICPTWSIETWTIWLEDTTLDVSEAQTLKGHRSSPAREVKKAARRLSGLCDTNDELKNMPDSLKKACVECARI